MLDDQNESSVERIYWRNVIAMIISWTVWIPFQSACWIYFQAFLKELHITPFQIALISFAGTITLALMRIPGGYLTDKVGRRKIIILLTYVVVFDYLIYAYASNFQVVLIATLISNLALLYQPALNAIVADSLPKTKRGKGYLLVNTLTSLASIASPLIA
ncbi:MAG: MFS transporter, partial [Candidatus Korarchaeota archaeon]|nr:MFS transporter [Candidatus Korarchaeota archaeon]